MSTAATKAGERAPIVHELKCHPGPFKAVRQGIKPFEWRKDDRLSPNDFRVGDTLWLREWDPTPIGTAISETDDANGLAMTEPIYRGYTGEEIHRTVTYIIREGFGIPEGYCIMGLADATIAELRSEVEEQARLLGAGASREAALMAEVERLKKVAQVACDALTDTRLAAVCGHDELDCMSEKFPLDKALEKGLSALSQLAENGIKPSK